jgi:hypothetical protein
MADKSGYLCIDWVYNPESEDGYEPIAGLNYWEVNAIVEALKPHMKQCRQKISYFEAKGEENRGTEVLREAHDSTESALEVFTNALNRMRDAYKEDDGAV